MLISFSAFAQQYPSQPIKYVIPYPPGGGTDMMGRVISDVLQQSLGQPVVVENKPGASTNIAASLVTQAKPDGYTIMQAENATLLYNEHLFAKLPYSPASDFTYIAGIGRMPLVLVINPNFNVSNLNEFITLIKNNRSKVNYASPGPGTPHHIAMELLKQKADLSITHIPYRGGASAIQGILGNQVDTMMLDVATATPLIKAGKVNAIALAAPTRAKILPDVPTFAELGYKEVNAVAFHGYVGPANMPADVVTKLNTEISKALANPKVQKALGDIGLEIQTTSPKDFYAASRKESQLAGEVIKRARITLE